MIKRVLVLLTMSSIASAAFAAADLRVTLTAATTAEPGRTYTARAVVANVGDAPATNVESTIRLALESCERPLGTIETGPAAREHLCE